jgi:hypothetical protein
VNLFIPHVLALSGESPDRYRDIRMALNHLEWREGLWRCIRLNDDGSPGGDRGRD